MTYLYFSQNNYAVILNSTVVCITIFMYLNHLIKFFITELSIFHFSDLGR